MLWLFLYTLLISLYDLRTGKVPNWATLPVLLAGFLIHFPGDVPAWSLSLFVLFAWHIGQMSAGDAKLWMALFWALPVESALFLPSVFFMTLIGTALLQILWRELTSRPLTGLRTPGAWRTIPFLLWCWLAH